MESHVGDEFNFGSYQFSRTPPFLEPNFISFERFQLFTAVKIQVEVFWVLTPCSVVVRY